MLTLPTTQIIAWRRWTWWSSTLILIGTGSRPSALAAATKYAPAPILSFSSGSVSSMIIASMPIPAITAKCSPVVPVDRQLDQVDGPGPPGQGDLDRLGLALGDVQVAGEQVGCALRDDAHRDAGAGQAVGDHAYGAVPAGRDHQVDLLGDGGGDHRPAGVVLRGLQPQRLGPAALAQRLVTASRKPSDTLIGLATTAQRPRAPFVISWSSRCCQSSIVSHPIRDSPPVTARSTFACGGA